MAFIAKNVEHLLGAFLPVHLQEANKVEMYVSPLGRLHIKVDGIETLKIDRMESIEYDAPPNSFHETTFPEPTQEV